MDCPKAIEVQGEAGQHLTCGLKPIRLPPPPGNGGVIYAYNPGRGQSRYYPFLLG